MTIPFRPLTPTTPQSPLLIEVAATIPQEVVGIAHYIQEVEAEAVRLIEEAAEEAMEEVTLPLGRCSSIITLMGEVEEEEAVILEGAADRLL